MTTDEKVNDPRASIGDLRCEPDRNEDRTLFERAWHTRVIRRDEEGKFRSFTECCDVLTPA